MRVLRLLAILPVVVTVGVSACVGDDATPGATSGGTDAATTPPTTNPGTDGGGQSDSGPGPACATGTGDCDGNPANGCETDLRASAEHCGKCGRKCGGTATCTQSECGVERLRDGLDHPTGLELAGPRLVWYEVPSAAIRGCRADDCNTSTVILADVNGPAGTPTATFTPRQIAVSGTKFYFAQCPTGSNSDCRPASCDVTGCKLTGATFEGPANGHRRASVLVGGPNAIYTHHGLDGLVKTDLGTKQQSYPTLGVQDQLQAMYIDTKQFVFVDDNASQANPTGGVYTCAATGCVGAPKLLLPPPVKHLAFAGDTAFSSTGGSNAAAGSILGCAVTGCAGGGTVLATNQAYVSDIAADATAVYWSTVGAANVTTNPAAVGTIMRCALPACAGGPTKIADTVTNPVSVRIDADYVYWLTHGTPTNKDGAVFRRRR